MATVILTSFRFWQWNDIRFGLGLKNLVFCLLLLFLSNWLSPWIQSNYSGHIFIEMNWNVQFKRWFNAVKGHRIGWWKINSREMYTDWKAEVDWTLPAGVAPDVLNFLLLRILLLLLFLFLLLLLLLRLATWIGGSTCLLSNQYQTEFNRINANGMLKCRERIKIQFRPLDPHGNIFHFQV